MRAENDIVRIAAAMIRLNGGDKERPLKEKKEAAREKTTSQNEATPRTEMMPPAMCAPTVPRRLCAFPNDPDTFQKTLSAGWYDKRLAPRTTDTSRNRRP
jgi:hypothetical protein